MQIVEEREQKLAIMKKNLKLVVVALLVLAIEKMIDMVVSFVTGKSNGDCAKTNLTTE